MELTKKQTSVLYQITEGIKNGEMEQTLGGYAGTGKTTLIRYICQFFPNFAVAAYTGKAANVLRKKDVGQATTIHSRIYIPDIQNGVLVGFQLASKNELNCEGFIIDEASMVTQEIYEDLAYYNLPIIYVGDHGQLEPVGSNFNLMTNPMYRLEEIHRNANDIAKFAESLRKGRNSFQFNGTEDRVIFKTKKQISDHDLMEADQVICAYNATRVALNKRIRRIKGFTGGVQKGDRVMCLQNNKDLNLFNGMQGEVTDVYEDRKGKPLMDFTFDETLYSGIWYDTRFFNVEKPEFDYTSREHPIPFDFADAITCHKAQGDEWEKGLVFEQKCKNWDHKRWAYTAASRFKENLTWAY